MRRTAIFFCTLLTVIGSAHAGQQAAVGASLQQLAEGAFMFESEGSSIHYEVHGSGPVLMTLPNSWGLSLQGLRNQYRPLEQHLTMVYFDPRGMGRSDPVRDDTDMSMAAVRTDFDALRRHLGLEKVNVIGWSNGATNLILLASEHPEIIARAIFLHTSPAFTMDDVQALQAAAPQMMEANLRFQKVLSDPELTPERADELTKQFAIDGWGPLLAADPETAPAMLHAIFDEARFSWAHSRYSSREMSVYDFRDRLGAITAPSLVIAGRHDMLPVARAEEMATGLPAGQLVVLENSGHFGPTEQTDEFIAAVTAFLAP